MTERAGAGPDPVRVVDLSEQQEAAIAAACGLARPGDRPVTAGDVLTALDADEAARDALLRVAAERAAWGQIHD
jgi:hypothetical protein